MNRTLPEWQQAAHAEFVRLGEYDCPECTGEGFTRPESGSLAGCRACKGTTRRELTPTFIVSRLARIHLEISRAVECVVDGGEAMELYWVNDSGSVSYLPTKPDDSDDDTWSPEGFPAALATVFLRLCDLAEALGIELREDDESSTCESTSERAAILSELVELHDALAEFWPHSSTADHQLNDELWRLFYTAHRTSVDLHNMASLKLDWWMRQGKELAK